MRLHSTDYFINDNSGNSQRINGFWEPHTASIDFCEPNYLLSEYVAEPHNVLSCFWGITIFGVIGLLYENPTGEIRFQLIHWVVIIISLGSAALHTSLSWLFQSTDELPMCFVVLCGIYNIIEIDSPHNKLNYPNLPWHLGAVAAATTILYYRFQHIYVAFLTTFTLLLCWILALHLRLSRFHYKKIQATGNPNSVICLRYYTLHFYVLALVGLPVWLLDQLRCQDLLPIYDLLPWPLVGCTLHVVWHAMGGLGIYYLTLFFVACRLDALGKACKVEHVMMGTIPVVVVASVGGDDRNDNKKRI